ncbi:actin cytoskeleton-regulatory complex protein PAN1-like [Ceratina calcarata]|uniref:Actin cytoskeleton-regulatory complex protein PAN1-like n=1 Tax=Ceratina calcarata TaxID=156304 RepID=A0AAJ7N6S9_9HYME|nr:actin cytoskeleton-regulatory complex protein PAN1-like [Ceratina calcarata]
MESWPACRSYHRNLNGDIGIRTRRRGVVRGSVRHKRAGTTPSVTTIATRDTRDTAMRVAVILLACVTALTSAQYNQDVDNLSPKGLPATLRSARFQRLPSARPVLPTQAAIALANQRIRRPITFKPKGSEDSIATGPGSFTPIKPLRPLPILPSAPSPAPPQVRPVNEEPEEDTRNRDSQDDENSDLSDEPLDSQEESEENLPRNIANLGSISRTSNIGPSAQPVQYRPLSAAGGPIGRGSITPATPAPAPVQYRPTPKPTKPRKPVEESYKQQVKPPTKPVKTEPYDARGKKPVAQIIRRYRNDNADGSITWGFENDDGSYKEELIGVDCITRGKYGYIDPDGNRREYTYETGIKCDEQQEEEDNGFVDYHENKLVLPDGKTIDLSTMGKKQSRRPRQF